MNNRKRRCERSREPAKFEIKFIEFNPIRAERGKEAARVSVNGTWLWMSEADIDRNLKIVGRNAELIKAKMAYSLRLNVKSEISDLKGGAV